MATKNIKRQAAIKGKSHLYVLRIEKQLTLAEVAEEFGVTRQAVAKMENKENWDRIRSRILALCAIYNVSPNVLLEWRKDNERH